MSPAGSVTIIGLPTESTEQIEAIALGSCLRLGLHQTAIVVLELLARAAEIGDVPQHRNDRGRVALERHARRQQLEQQIRTVLGIDEDHFPDRGQRRLHQPSRERGREEQVVDLDGASSALALSGRIAKSCSARMLPMINFPDSSVSRIGSVTELMML